MPIDHLFLNSEPGKFPDQNFYTENVILKNETFKPEVMIIGTFNPNTPKTNFADFFYGRNYFWTGFKKLLDSNYEFFKERRMPTKGKAVPPYNPTLNEILNLTTHFKLTFSDLIKKVFPNVGPDEFSLIEKDNVLFRGKIYNLIRDKKEKGVLGLEELNRQNQVEWNTKHIIDFLIQNPQIKFIYFTRNIDSVWLDQWNIIKSHPRLTDRHFSNIISPNGQGKLINPGVPYKTPLKKILHYWVWNGLNHSTNPVKTPNFGHLDHDWLARCGVDVNQF